MGAINQVWQQEPKPVKEITMQAGDGLYLFRHYGDGWVMWKTPARKNEPLKSGMTTDEVFAHMKLLGI